MRDGVEVLACGVVVFWLTWSAVRRLEMREERVSGRGDGSGLTER